MALLEFWAAIDHDFHFIFACHIHHGIFQRFLEDATTIADTDRAGTISPGFICSSIDFTIAQSRYSFNHSQHVLYVPPCRFQIAEETPAEPTDDVGELRDVICLERVDDLTREVQNQDKDKGEGDILPIDVGE